MLAAGVAEGCLDGCRGLWVRFVPCLVPAGWAFWPAGQLRARIQTRLPPVEICLEVLPGQPIFLQLLQLADKASTHYSLLVMQLIHLL